ncbi:type II toxin-antitoxin system HicB family antitoxin [Herbaspirillum robiniae]|uniref:type II toxin-antitoxin system HicB family antitoxin n=1 Tax=Herbaspirillum robiniae TaxID=2014887 RepID=UPI0009A18101|nr:type II toxin-antitoxin system HicB family antitoxin [Herbaspirillum robiniae]
MELLLAIQKDENSVFGVTVPAIEGCFSWGDTLEEAVKNARDAIEMHLDATLEIGGEIGIANVELDEVKRNFENAHFVFIEIDDRKVDRSPERINISVPRFVLNKIDDYVETRHESRSGFLARAALRTISEESDIDNTTHAPA